MDSRSELVTVEVPSGSTNQRGAAVSAPVSRRKRLVYFLNASIGAAPSWGLCFLPETAFLTFRF